MTTMNKKLPVTEDTRDLIIAEMKRQKRRLPWLAEETGIPYGTLYSTLVNKMAGLQKYQLAPINKALKTHFELPKAV